MSIDDFPFNALTEGKNKVPAAGLLDKVRLEVRRHNCLSSPLTVDLEQNNEMVTRIVEVMNVYWKLGILEEDIREEFHCVACSYGSGYLEVRWVVGDGDKDGEYEDFMMNRDGLFK